MNQKIFHILFFLFVLSNISGISQTLNTINIDPHARTKGDLMMSDLVQSIEYIPLETTKDCLIGNITLQAITNNYIAIFCNQSTQVLLFNRNGKFIAQIGHKGNGPSEYLEHTIQSIHIEESMNQIFIQTNHLPRLLYYDLTGKFLKTETMNHPIGHIHALVNNHFFIAIDNGGNTIYTYELRDRNREIIKQWGMTPHYDITNHSYRSASTMIFPMFNSYLYEDKIHIRETSINDTLYVMGKDFSFTPKYVLNTGKYRITPEIRGNVNNFFRNLEASIQMTSVNETPNYILLSYKYQKNMHYGYYDKSQDKIFYFLSDNGIPNDYDTGIPLWPQTQQGKKLYAFYDVYKMEELSSKQKKIDAKEPDDTVKAFNKMFDNLNPDDNPVLVIMTLK